MSSSRIPPSRSSAGRTPGRRRSSARSRDRVPSCSIRQESRGKPYWPPLHPSKAEDLTMGLLGMMARTAVVAGTATAVSGRVARRQQGRYQQKADAQAYQEQQAAPQEPQYQQQPAYQEPAPAPAPAAAGPPNLVDEIQRLSTLKDQGILSEDEFTAAK